VCSEGTSPQGNGERYGRISARVPAIGRDRPGYDLKVSLKSMMKYKGYTGLPEIDEQAGVIFGRVIGLRDVITFQGTSVTEATQAFHDSVDDYLEFCAERGEQPEKPYSGNFVVRVAPELHRALANSAEAQNVSLNHLVEAALARMFPDVTGGGMKEPARERTPAKKKASKRRRGA
jgi:predicted HicB family RNase H-like nuclease